MPSKEDEDLAVEILHSVRRLNLPFELDEITEGKGDCFPLAVIAQCRRTEIFSQLTKSVQAIITGNNPTLLRNAVKFFIENSQERKIQEFKKNYEEVLAKLDNRCWKEYWKVMCRQFEWVDQIFIQATAWFLNHDIFIITTTSTRENPYIVIEGKGTSGDFKRPENSLILGCKSQLHYQSLLPTKKDLPMYSETPNPIVFTPEVEEDK